MDTVDQKSMITPKTSWGRLLGGLLPIIITFGAVGLVAWIAFMRHP